MIVWLLSIEKVIKCEDFCYFLQQIIASIRLVIPTQFTAIYLPVSTCTLFFYTNILDLCDYVKTDYRILELALNTYF